MSRGRNHKQIEKRRRQKRALQHKLEREVQKAHVRLLLTKTDTLPPSNNSVFKTRHPHRLSKLHEVLQIASQLLTREEQRSQTVTNTLHELSEDPNVSDEEILHYRQLLRTENKRVRERKRTQ